MQIRSVYELELLMGKRRRPRRPDRLVLAIRGLPDADARVWEAKLSRYYFACGCEAASVVLAVVLAAYIVAVALTSGGFGSFSWRDLVVGAGIGFAAAGIGKLAGLLHARRRLRATVRALSERLGDVSARPA